MATTAEQITALESRRDTIIARINAIESNNQDLPNHDGGLNVNHIEKIRAWYEELGLIEGRLLVLSYGGAWDVTSEMSA